jgi:putative adenylate-forming enzyme
MGMVVVVPPTQCDQGRYFDLTINPDDIVAQLRALRPNVIVGPPAMLMVIAGLVESGRIELSPEQVFSGAEVLEPQDRLRIERALRVQVRDIYHTTEGLMGLSCSAGRMHIQEDVTFVELEPLGDGRFTPVMTQLFRRTQPFIRYRMNDVVTIDDQPCPCGSVFRVIARVEGRCDDSFYLRHTDGRLKLVFADQIRCALLDCDGVTDYRAHQLGTDHIRVFVDSGDGFDQQQLTTRLHARMGSHDCVAPRIDIHHGIPPESDRTRKLIRVRRLFTPVEVQ